jgi:hypothetical protein
MVARAFVLDCAAPLHPTALGGNVKSVIRTALALFLVLLPAPEGQSRQTPSVPAYSGNDLLRDCTNDKAIKSLSFCLGFIAGTWSGAAIEGVDYHPGKPNFVIPSEADLPQLKDVVVKFLNEHPEERHLSAGVLVLLALKEAFPPTP